MHIPSLWRRSIAWRLSFFVLLPVLILLVLAGSLTAYRSELSVDKLYDQQMQQNASILIAFLGHEQREESFDEHEDEDENEEEDLGVEMDSIVGGIEKEQQRVVDYRVFLGESVLFSTDAAANLPRCSSGFSTFKTIAENEWRCYKRDLKASTPANIIEVEFFDKLQRRRDSNHALLFSTFAPFLFLPLIIVFIVLWAVRRGLTPLRAVSAQIEERSVSNLQRLPTEDLARELAPVVHSVNGLLESINNGIEREKRFSDDAAHELRTPLTSMSMLEQLLRRENTDPRLTQHLDGLQKSIEKGQRMVNQLLLFARLQSSQSLVFETLLLNDLVEEQLGSLSSQITEKELSITLDLGEPLYISANRDAMELLLTNIIGNAIKFVGYRGHIDIGRSGSRLHIEDDGPGVPDSEKERIFDRFYRSSKTTDRRGSGLGLSLSKWAADRHKFILSCVQAKQGTGARFVLDTKH